jgi:hypothetical protein
LAKKFIIYLAICHRESRNKLKRFMNQNGGYILHLDGTCEVDSPHLMTGLDGISDIVLENIKLPSEKADKIIPFLNNIKNSYGNPLALVHDMGKGILAAVKKVFPDIPDYICHFHFLRDIGKDLFGEENDIIRKKLSKHGIQGQLRKRLIGFTNDIEENPDNVEIIFNCINQKKQTDQKNLMPVTIVYTLILWALEGKKQGKGYGFPFDRPYFNFYQRLQTIYSTIKEIESLTYKNVSKKKNPYKKVISDLKGVITDEYFKSTVLKMKKKLIIFDKLREAMRIALPLGNNGLNDEGEKNIKTIEKRVRNFTDWLCNNKSINQSDGYDKMIEQIKKYWKKLFADPIIVNSNGKQIIIQPQRTNNKMEQLFRYCKHNHRKRTGVKPSSRNLKAFLANTLYVKNLSNKNYMNIILNGKKSLEERFAEIETKLVREELLKAGLSNEKIPFKIKKIIKKSKLPKILLAHFQTKI